MSDAAYSLGSEPEEAGQAPEPRVEPSRARPIPRVNIQAFCEDQATAVAIQKAALPHQI